jgi:hypothetical protein
VSTDSWTRVMQNWLVTCGNTHRNAGVKMLLHLLTKLRMQTGFMQWLLKVPLTRNQSQWHSREKGRVK